MSWLLAGGFPMVFVVLFGLWATLGALRFAWAPVPGHLPSLVAAALTCVTAGLAGTLAGIVAMSVKIPAHPEWHADLAMTVIIGLGEALTPLLLGLTVATVVSLLAAVGLRRR